MPIYLILYYIETPAYRAYLEEVQKVAGDDKDVRLSVDLRVGLQLLKVDVHLLVGRVQRVKGALLEQVRRQPGGGCVDS